jgi:hypothetical protein
MNEITKITKRKIWREAEEILIKSSQGIKTKWTLPKMQMNLQLKSLRKRREIKDSKPLTFLCWTKNQLKF